MNRQEVIAAAIATARGMRRGVPRISNILEVLPPKLRDEVMDDAAAVIEALGEPAAAPVDASVEQLKSVIQWANGEIGEWPERKPNEGAFYWRTELMRRYRQALLAGGTTQQRRLGRGMEEFPRGKLNADDEGALQIGITVKDKTLIIDFGKPVAWVGLDRATARSLHETLGRRIEEI